MTNYERAIDKLRNLLTEASRTSAWGEINVCLKDGKVTLVRLTTQMKIDEENPRNGSRQF